VTESEILEKQTRKLRRRIEDFLRHTTPAVLIKIAYICGISVPKVLRDKHEEE